MAKRTIAAPTRGRVIIYNATHLVAIGDDMLDYIVPAIVHQPTRREGAADEVLIWAVDAEGTTLTWRGTLPAARFGESAPGVPAVECWCYPPRADEQIEVGSDFDPEETLDPAHP